MFDELVKNCSLWIFNNLLLYCIVDIIITDGLILIRTSSNCRIIKDLVNNIS